MMTRQKRLTLLALLILLLLLLLVLVWWMFLRSPRVVTVPQADTSQQEPQVIPTRPTISEEAKQAEREVRVSASDVVSLSKSFVVRYGSYSNEARFANLIDVLPLMSESFARETEAFIAASEVPEGYYGITTRVVVVKVDQTDEATGTAQVTVTTQREESIDSPQQTQIRYQDIVLTFVKEADTWFVDSAVWQ